MEDTTQDAQDIVHQTVMAKTVEQRLLLCAQMYEDAKEFARIGMPEGLSEEEQRDFVFRRIHGVVPRELVDDRS